MVDADFVTTKQIRLTQGFIDQALLKLDTPTPVFNQDDLAQFYSLIDLAGDYDSLVTYLIGALNTKKTALETQFNAL